MRYELQYKPRDPAEFPNWTFENLDFEYDPTSMSVWMSYKADGPPFYTFQTLTDMADVRESLRALFFSDQRARFPIRYSVMASHKPGIFNLGGDLAKFAQAVEDRDAAFLRGYAHACIDVVYGLATSYGLPIVSLSVLTGQALGGGLESSLAQDVLIAEDTAKLGVPEVAFNTFPGMGAVTLLSRRLGLAGAEQIIASGKVYSGQEMFDLGGVDIVVPDGTAHQAAHDWMIDGGAERHARRLAIAVERRRTFPVFYDDLINITDVWVGTALDVSPQDIRHMRRLVAAQKKVSK